MKPKLILCLALVLSGGLFGCSTTKPPGAANVQADSFLDWIDDTNTDNYLVKGHSLAVEMDSSPDCEISFTTTPGEAFVFGCETTGKQTARLLKCADGQSGQVHAVYLSSIPNDAYMAPLVESTTDGHHILHFLEEGERNEPPKSITTVELDEKYQVVRIMSAKGMDGDREKFNGTKPNPNDWSDLGIIYSSFWASPGHPAQISWPKNPVAVLFEATGLPQQPKMYVFREDTFFGVRKLPLMPIENIIFIKSANRILLKAWFGIESRTAGTDQPDSKRPIATATWSLDIDHIERAFITTGRWLLIDGNRGNKRVFLFYDLTKILDQAAKNHVPDAQAVW